MPVTETVCAERRVWRNVVSLVFIERNAGALRWNDLSTKHSLTNSLILLSCTWGMNNLKFIEAMFFEVPYRTFAYWYRYSKHVCLVHESAVIYGTRCTIAQDNTLWSGYLVVVKIVLICFFFKLKIYGKKELGSTKLYMCSVCFVNFCLCTNFLGIAVCSGIM